ncbi:MAG: hypothetical protein CMF45_03575 [Legionellales bacterium]|nr:hypothetical protein [Legionellales bacterium]|tara:strand:- start:57 stop:293 length:237 start_codon:yes stop_codon:yes gene_type:complete
MKNILLGFLMATCMFLMIGATQEMFVTTSDNGRYQAYSTEGSNKMIDTKTGVLYKYAILGKNKKKWTRLSSETDWIVE